MNDEQLRQRFPRASDAFIRANLSAGDAWPVAKLESNVGHAALDEKEVQRSTPARFCVRIGTRRKRLLDEDNICEKYLIDALRYCGAIPDDNPERTKIEVHQTKCRKGEAEEITIEVFLV